MKKTLIASAAILGLAAFSTAAMADGWNMNVSKVKAVSSSKLKQSGVYQKNTGSAAAATTDNNSGDHTFTNQKINNNNLNAGVNAVQGGSISIAGAMGGNLSGGGFNLSKVKAVSMSKLKQTYVKQKNYGDYAAKWTDNNLGSETFRYQKINNNNLNAGVNAVQGGGISIAAAAGGNVTCGCN